MTGTFLHYNKDFDNQFRYDEKDLGAICSKEGTIFKVWCPLADRIKLHLYRDGKDSLEFAEYEMIPGLRGVWCFQTEESLHGTYYDYTIVRGNEKTRTADPYAIACGVNGFRSMVVDLTQTDPEGFAQDKAPEKQKENIIYELHIKDFSYDPQSGIPEEYRGKYKAFTVKETKAGFPTCVEYLQKLGVTHVHLLPMYDFGWLDEEGSDIQFNWGYDPVNYNVPEGSFATDVYDGCVRIRECKEMVQALHQAGIRVIMDVVYNHTYEPDSWLERTVPGYYNRRWEDGSLANGSACGSDIACGRAMVDNYIADSVMYWAKEYHIDGFRFDLMGLLTVELMNRIRKELDEAFGEGEKLLYGEPWRATESPMEEGTNAALKCNVQMLDDGIAMFSDDTRDVVKGHVFYEELPGFVNGGKGLEEKLLGAVTGWCVHEAEDGTCGNGEDTFRPKSCNQIINYISAHDNFTLWDKLVLSVKGGHGVNNEYRQETEPVTDKAVYTQKYEDILEANKLAAFIYFTCQGHIFFQAGEEFGRTKFGDGNSYRSDPELNMLRWNQTLEFADLLEYYEGLISLRKKLPGLYDKSAAAAARVSQKKIWKPGLVSYMLDNTEHCESPCPDGGKDNGETWSQLFVIYNGEAENAAIDLPEGDWIVLADKHNADCRKELNLTPDGRLLVEAKSGMIVARR